MSEPERTEPSREGNDGSDPAHPGRAVPPSHQEPATARPGLTERIKEKLKALLDDDPNIYPLY